MRISRYTSPPEQTNWENHTASFAFTWKTQASRNCRTDIGTLLDFGRISISYPLILVQVLFLGKKLLTLPHQL